MSARAGAVGSELTMDAKQLGLGDDNRFAIILVSHSQCRVIGSFGKAKVGRRNRKGWGDGEEEDSQGGKSIHRGDGVARRKEENISLLQASPSILYIVPSISAIDSASFALGGALRECCACEVRVGRGVSSLETSPVNNVTFRGFSAFAKKNPDNLVDCFPIFKLPFCSLRHLPFPTFMRTEYSILQRPIRHRQLPRFAFLSPHTPSQMSCRRGSAEASS